MPLPLVGQWASRERTPAWATRASLYLPPTSHLNVPSLLLLQCPAAEHAAEQEEGHTQSGDPQGMADHQQYQLDEGRL